MDIFEFAMEKEKFSEEYSRSSPSGQPRGLKNILTMFG